MNVFIRIHDAFEVLVDEVIVRIEMLFDETLDFEKCRQKVPFVLHV